MIHKITLMQGEFECTKIKDGLYLGTLAAVQDYEFLQINKFSYIVNCSAEVPNYFEPQGLKYLKFKLVKERTHNLWDEQLKKLRKLQRFIQEAEEHSLCCIIFSASGNNRSLVMLTALLMSRYRWTLSKTLKYVRSKNIFIGLSEHYIRQLEVLECILKEQEGEDRLSAGWGGPYRNSQEEIIAKTFVNSQEIPFDLQSNVPKKEKRVTWQDRIDKERRKELKEKLRQSGIDQFRKTKSGPKNDSNNPNNSFSQKAIKKETVESPLKKSQQLKRHKKGGKSSRSINKIESTAEVRNDELTEGAEQQSEPNADMKPPSKYFSQDELISLIKKNLKIKRKKGEEGNKENQEEKDKEVYKLTINNFIAPNINFMGQQPPNSTKPLGEKSTKAINRSKKDDKSTRALSDKEARRSNETLKSKPEVKVSRGKKGRDVSPMLRDKKIEKAVSLQIKKPM